MTVKVEYYHPGHWSCSIYSYSVCNWHKPQSATREFTGTYSGGTETLTAMRYSSTKSATVTEWEVGDGAKATVRKSATAKYTAKAKVNGRTYKATAKATKSAKASYTYWDEIERSATATRSATGTGFTQAEADDAATEAAKDDASTAASKAAKAKSTAAVKALAKKEAGKLAKAKAKATKGAKKAAKAKAVKLAKAKAKSPKKTTNEAPWV